MIGTKAHRSVCNKQAAAIAMAIRKPLADLVMRMAMAIMDERAAQGRPIGLSDAIGEVSLERIVDAIEATIPKRPAPRVIVHRDPEWERSSAPPRRSTPAPHPAQGVAPATLLMGEGDSVKLALGAGT